MLPHVRAHARALQHGESPLSSTIDARSRGGRAATRVAAARRRIKEDCMRKTMLWCSLISVALLGGACKKSESEKAADQVRKSVEEVRDQREDVREQQKDVAKEQKDVVKEQRELAEAQGELAKARANYVVTARERLARLDAKINDLERRADMKSKTPRSRCAPAATRSRPSSTRRPPASTTSGPSSARTSTGRSSRSSTTSRSRWTEPSVLARRSRTGAAGVCAGEPINQRASPEWVTRAERRDRSHPVAGRARRDACPRGGGVLKCAHANAPHPRRRGSFRGAHPRV